MRIMQINDKTFRKLNSVTIYLALQGDHIQEDSQLSQISLLIQDSPRQQVGLLYGVP